jgi:hypothetical protein
VSEQGTTVIYKSPGPVAKAFGKSEAFICGIRGPIGSGKSTRCVTKLIKNAYAQPPGPDGVARRRTAIIRNTYPELRTTTMNTWDQWVPTRHGWASGWTRGRRATRSSATTRTAS